MRALERFGRERIVSDSVGCGWTVRPMSSASAPISIASAASAIRSPAFGPTMPAPSRRSLVLVEQQLGQALGAGEPSARPRGRPGKAPLPYLMPLRLGLGLGQADPGDLGIGVGDRGDAPGVEEAVLAGGDLGRDLGLVGRLVREHRLADDVADREDVRDVGALLAVDRDEAALVDRDARALGADRLAVRPPADRDQDPVEDLSVAGAFVALEA